MDKINTNKNTIDSCLKRLDLIESTIYYCSDKEAGRKIGVYESAAKQIREHVGHIQEQLSQLKRSV